MPHNPVWKFRDHASIQAILQATADRKSGKSRYVPTYPLIVHHDPLPPLRARSLAAAMDVFNGPTKPHRIRLVVGRQRQPLECICLCVGVGINCCMKILYILHKYNDVNKNKEDGGRRQIVRGNPAMWID